MKTILTILTAALLALGAQAQNPGERPEPSFTAVKDALRLTDAQITQLRTLETQTMSNLQSTFEEMRTKQGALRSALRATPVDNAAVARLTAEIAALRQKVETTRTAARNSAVALLTSDQKASLAQLEQALKLMPAAGQAGRLNLLAPPDRNDDGIPGRGFAGRRPVIPRGGQPFRQ